MDTDRQKEPANILTAPLKLRSNWKGKVVLSGLSEFAFSVDQWRLCLANPDSLLIGSDQIIKQQGRNIVLVKSIRLAGGTLKVVVKRHYPELNIRSFFRSFRRGRALRNFDTTLRLLRFGLPVAPPLAAIEQKKFPRSIQSIHVTKYIENGVGLHQLLAQLPPSPTKSFEIKKQLSLAVAQILAALHKAGCWHRDAKTSNFIAAKDTGGKYRLLITDMDGIKAYRLRKKSSQFRPFWHLAASLLHCPGVTRTDRLRTFTAYCNLLGIGAAERRRLFRWIAAETDAKYMRSLKKAAAKRTLTSGELNNILILKPSALGDIVLALPALSVLRKSFPNAKISWLVRTEFAALLEKHPYLDEIIPFERKYLGRAWRDPKALAALLALVRRLRTERFDAVFDLQGLLRTASLAWLSRCPNRFGMAGAREFAPIFYNRKIQQDPTCIHLVDYYLKIVKAAGPATTDVEFTLPEDPVAADFVKRLLQKHNVALDNYVVLIPGSARPSKCWPAERFARLADKIISIQPRSVVAIGSPAERKLAEKIKALAKTHVVNLAGQTSIPQLTALLKSAKLVVGNDTGPAHIAAALDVPVVVIFGPTNPARVAPYHKKNSVVAIDPGSRGLKPDSTNPKYAIENVTLDMVLEKVAQKLKSPPF